MAFSRREFVRRLGAGGAGVAAASHIIGYGREELLAFTGQAAQQAPAAAGATGGPAPIRLSSNENLRGPSPKVIEALKAHPSRDLGLGYPPPNVSAFVDACAAMDGAKPNNIIISTGSGEILTAAVMAYCNGDKSLVTGDPSYGSPAQTAQRIKAPVKFIAVEPENAGPRSGRHDPRLDRRRARVPLQPEQSDIDGANVGGRRADGPHDQAALAGNRHPDRRGLSRVRDEAGRVHDGEAGARIAGRVRLAHVLQGLRHGRHAHGLRDWPARHGQKSRQCVGPRQHQRAAGGGRHRGVWPTRST